MKRLIVLLIFALTMRAVASITVTHDRTSGRALYLLVAGVDRSARGAGVSESVARAAAESFLAAHSNVFGIANMNELKFGRVETDKLGFSHVFYYQFYDDLPVIGGELRVHLNTRGEVYVVNGKHVSGIALSTVPSVTVDDAKYRAVLQCQNDFMPMNTPDAASAKLVVLPLGIVTPPNPPVNGGGSDDVHLAWEVNVLSDEGQDGDGTYYMDAHDGRFLFFISAVKHLDRRVYDCSFPTSPNCRYNATDASYPGYVFGRSEGQPVRGPNPRPGIFFGSEDVDDCYDYLGAIHNYWLTTFGRNGANFMGGLGDGYWVPYAQSIGNVYRDNQSGWGCPGNAGYYSAYGFIYFCVGMVVSDAVGHEYGHGITFWNFRDSSNNPIGTTLSGQTGALEESYSDVCGEASEISVFGAHDWLVGTDCIRGVIRNMQAPAALMDWRTGLPFPDRSCSPYAVCGADIHTLSTINSHASYLMSEGGEFNGCYIDGIGFDAVQRVFYRAWTTYFTRTVTFNEAVTGLQQACLDLYPDSLGSVTAALQAVEMDQPGRCSGIPERAPFCAVHSAGVVSTNAIAYLNQPVVVAGANGVANHAITFYLAPHPADRSIWREIATYRGVQTLDTIASDGTLLATVWLPDTLGIFDIIVDENSDGFYQPWADTILSVTVQVPQNVSGLVAKFAAPARVQLNWNAFAGATGYIIEADSTLEFYAPEILGTVSDTSFVDSTSVSTKNRLLYRVRAVW